MDKSGRKRLLNISFVMYWGSNLLIAQFANKLIEYCYFFPFAAFCFGGWIICIFIINNNG